MASPWIPQPVELPQSRRVVLVSRVLGVLLICFGITAKLGTSAREQQEKTAWLWIIWSAPGFVLLARGERVGVEDGPDGMLRRKRRSRDAHSDRRLLRPNTRGGQ
jgi:hypothetical protein